MQPFSAFRQLRKSLNLTKKIILSFMWALFFLTVSTNASFKLFLCFSCYHISTNSIALPFSLRTSHNTQFLNLLCRRVNIKTWAFSVKKCLLVAKPPPKELFSTPFHPLPQRWLFQNWQSSFHLSQDERRLLVCPPVGSGPWVHSDMNKQ